MPAVKEKSSRKLEIINAAFSFYESPGFVKFSLSDVAKKVGISKPAIFRHFKNKDDLIGEMRKYFFEMMAELNLYLISGAELEPVIKFFSKHPQYIYYVCNEFMTNKGYEKIFCENLNIDYGSLVDKSGRVLGDKLNLFIRGVYFFCTVFIFLQYQHSLKKQPEKNNDPEAQAKRLANLFQNGMIEFFPENEKKTQKSSQELLKFLKELKIDKKELPEVNKFITAVAKAAESDGVLNITIEKIAQALGWANSSIYSHYENKQSFLESVVNEEKDVFLVCMEKNRKYIKTPTDFLFVSMATTLNYLEARPSVIPLFGWLRMTGNYVPEEYESDDEIDAETKLYIDWCICITITLIIEAKNGLFKMSDLDSIVVEVYQMMFYGVKE